MLHEGTEVSRVSTSGPLVRHRISDIFRAPDLTNTCADAVAIVWLQRQFGSSEGTFRSLRLTVRRAVEEMSSF
jgi:hypothetical protein